MLMSALLGNKSKMRKTELHINYYKQLKQTIMIRAIAIVILSLIMLSILYWGHILGIKNVKFFSPPFFALILFFSWIAYKEYKWNKEQHSEMEHWLDNNN